MSIKDNIDRRAFQRVDMALMIDCRRSKNSERFTIKTENVSANGVKFFSPSELIKGEILDMKIHLIHGFPPIISKGQVIWCNKIQENAYPYEGGINIIAININDRSMLEQQINKLSAEKGQIQENQ